MGQQVFFLRPSPILEPILTKPVPVAPSPPVFDVAPIPPIPSLPKPTTPEPTPVGPQPGHFPPDKPQTKPWKCPETESDCSKKLLSTLNGRVRAKCPGKGVVNFDACSKIWSSTWSCDAIKDLMNKWEACCNARRKRETLCFRGGNRGHRIQLANCDYQVSYCYYLLRYWECPGFGPNPWDPIVV